MNRNTDGEARYRCSERVNHFRSVAPWRQRSSRETAGSAKESILFRNTIGHRLSYRHSKRGSRFCSRWPRVKWGNLRVTARACSQSARHADPRGMERIQMPSIILDEYTIFMNEVNIGAINSSDISVWNIRTSWPIRKRFSCFGEKILQWENTNLIVERTTSYSLFLNYVWAYLSWNTEEVINTLSTSRLLQQKDSF